MVILGFVEGGIEAFRGELSCSQRHNERESTWWIIMLMLSCKVLCWVCVDKGQD